MDISGNGAGGADWMGEHHKDEALHQRDILWVARNNSLRPNSLELDTEAVQFGGHLICPLDDKGQTFWTDWLLGVDSVCEDHPNKAPLARGEFGSKILSEQFLKLLCLFNCTVPC